MKKLLSKISWACVMGAILGCIFFGLCHEAYELHETMDRKERESLLRECIHYHRTLDASQVHLSIYAYHEEKLVIDNCGKDWQ